VDDGLSASTAPAPDPAYHEGRFLWRTEILGETAIDAVIGKRIQASAIQAVEGSLEGRVLRITRGRGAGQENRVIANTDGSIEVAEAWQLEPDAGSAFCVSEASWRHAGSGRHGLASLSVANRPGATIQLIGVSANAAGEESDYRLAPFTRIRLVGDTADQKDSDVPGEPVFALSAGPQGHLQLSNLGLGSLENSRTIHSGTLRVHFVDELQPEAWALQSGIEEDGRELRLPASANLQVGDLVLVDEELLQIVEWTAPGTFEVSRGRVDSDVTGHAAGSECYRLSRANLSAPLAGGFFGSPAAANYQARWPFANRRLVAAEFYLSNAIGDGTPARVSYAGLSGGGIRFPEGGSYAVQYSGVLSMKTSVAPALRIGQARTVHLIQASLGEAPLGGRVLVRARANENVLGTLEVGPGERTAVLEAAEAATVLPEGAELHVDILEVPGEPGTWPGRDLSLVVFV
jgi:hypothetical protein